MERYVALLRGVNVGGKNKVPMKELKTLFEELGFTDVKTHLNSGNVIFSSEEKDVRELKELIETALKNYFSFAIPTFVTIKENLRDVLQNAPDWWVNDNKEIYDNLIFIMPPMTFSEIYTEMGEPKAGLEKIKDYKEMIFWSFSRKDYQKTNWWSKTAKVSIKANLTIRTANTIKKIVTM